jgi:hypothetical protein
MMLQFSIYNFKEIEQIYIHDSELKGILVDYANKEVRVNLLSAQIKDIPQKQVEFIFHKVSYVHVPMNEPWGSGVNLHSLSVVLENTLIKTTLVLNSGDEITCLAELVKTNASY